MKRRPPVIVPAAVLAAAAILASSCGREPRLPRLKKPAETSLLLITVDALRADALGVFEGPGAATPRLDLLAERGAVFANVYAPAPQTLPSHATLFTGREPPAHGVRTDGGPGLPSSELSWAEAMRAAGFETGAIVSSFKLHSLFGLKQGFDFYDDSLDFGQTFNTPGTSIPADSVLTKFRSWLEKRSGGKFFAWVNFSDPSPRFEPPAESARASRNDPYGGAVAQVDQAVGEIMNLLEAGGHAGRTVVVLTGSHGVRLGEKREAGHGFFGREEMLRVPLVVHAPGLFPGMRRVERRVRLLDVMPSLLELFGLEIPPGVQGESFLPLIAAGREKEDTERSVYFESRYGVEEMGLAPLAGLIFGPYKLYSLPRDEVYDLRRDPGETKNLAAEEKELAEKMNARLRERLDRLGGAEPAVPIPDPEKAVEAAAALLEAERLLAEGKMDEAEQKLKDALRAHPEMKLPLAYDYLSFIASKKGDVGKTEAVLRRAASAYPDLGRFQVALAQLLADSARPDEAARLCDKALAADPRLSRAHVILAGIHSRKGETEQVLARLEKALDLEPMNFGLRLQYASQLAERGDRARAMGILEKLAGDAALAADPAGVPLRSDIAGLLIKIGESEMANALLLDIVSSGRGDGKTWTQVGLGYLEKGNVPKAAESLEKALSLDPDNGLALSGMGTLHLTLYRGRGEKEDLERAIAFYSKAKEASPGLVAAWNGLGVAWSYAGDRAQAVAHWRQALLVDPGFTNTYFNLGITLLQSGRKEEARAILSVCLEKHSAKLSESEMRQLRALLEEASR